MKRFDRLQQKDGYEDIRDGKYKRPKTQQQAENDKRSDLEKAIEREEEGDKKTASDRSKEPVSCIKMDDFEVYLRI